MNSAETINPGNFKLAVYPVRDFDAEETGVVGRVGFGLAEGLDVEGSIGFYDGLRYFAGNAELWVVRERGFDMSLGAGMHRSDFEGSFDVFGIDAFTIVSGHLSPSLELYGALDLDFERPDEPFDDYTLAHAVAGFEVRLARDLDLQLEGGLGINDRSSDYASAGLSFYFR